MTPWDSRICTLGEGPLWHPLRAQLYWFDILGQRLLTRDGDIPREWAFDEQVSAAGWIDAGHLLIASETGLWRFALETGARELVAPMEGDNRATRSNDGRADPQGGFWIGTMGKRAEAGAGAIYRWFRGELRRLYAPVTIPNAISFAPDGRSACFADTARQRVWRQALDAQGWPVGAHETFLDLSPQGLYPDGAVFDAEGGFWLAHWGAGQVARYRGDGTPDRILPLPAAQTTCPAFGGGRLFVTSAAVDLQGADALQGCVFALDPGVAGQAEHRVHL